MRVIWLKWSGIMRGLRACESEKRDVFKEEIRKILFEKSVINKLEEELEIYKREKVFLECKCEKI